MKALGWCGGNRERDVRGRVYGLWCEIFRLVAGRKGLFNLYIRLHYIKLHQEIRDEEKRDNGDESLTALLPFISAFPLSDILLPS